MQQIILPQAITSLIATDDNGKPIVNFDSALPVIKAVVQHLQDTRQNLSTADFVDFLFALLGITKDAGELSDTFFRALTSKFIDTTTDYAIVYCAIKSWLVEQRFDSLTYNRYLCILNADYPMQSTLNPKKIAVWRNTSKMGNWDKRQAVSVRKWIGSTLVGLTAEQAESLACKIDNLLQGETLTNLDVRHHSSYDFEAWERAYVNSKIRSCMNPNHTSCEVGTKRTFTTYCSGYHGLDDNGLSLTVLYQDGEPVARAITFKKGEQDCYIRSYGDDRLRTWLQSNNYEQSDFKTGTILYTTADLMKPYVDGDDVRSADHYINSDGKHYWLLSDEGEYDLQTTDAFADLQTECECCGNSFHGAALGEHQSAVNGNWYTVCDSCYEDNRYYVYTGRRHSEPLFFHDGYRPETNDGYIVYEGDYYQEDSLEEYDLRMIDDEVYHSDDLCYCEHEHEYFTRDGVYLNGDEISTTQPVYFPYECVSKKYWHDNVVECACGTLALEEETSRLGKPSLGDVVTLSAYWGAYRRYNGAGVELVHPIFKIDDIESDYDLYETSQMQAFLDYAKAYNTIQYLRFQELGI